MKDIFLQMEEVVKPYTLQLCNYDAKGGAQPHWVRLPESRVPDPREWNNVMVCNV